MALPLLDREKETFLRKLRTTNGNVAASARAIKRSRNCLYEARKNDPGFAERWDEVYEAIYDEMEQEAYRRAVTGVPEPVFYKGVLTATVNRHSDRLLEFLLKANRPEKFRDRLDLNQNVSGGLDVNLAGEIDRIYGTDDPGE